MNTAQSVVYFSPPMVVVRTFWAIGFLHCEVKLLGHRSPRSQVNRFKTCRMLVTLTYHKYHSISMTIYDIR